MTTVAFTGHRPKDLFGYNDHELWKQLKDAIGQHCRRLVETQGVDTFISGGAQGVDQTAFWAIETLKRKHHPHLKNLLYAPAPCQPSRWLKYGLFSQDEYATMCACADEVRFIGTDADMQANAPKLLYGRNIAMIEDADIMIAVTDIRSLAAAMTLKGGTAHAIRESVEHGKRIFRLNPYTREMVPFPEK